jgi:GMP synthase-like glutamine amidotransferase
MIIGILQTDTVRPEFAKLFGEYPAMFQSLLLGIAPGLHFRIYDVQHNIYPGDIHECDAYVITGSKASVYDAEPWIGTLQKFIVTLDQQQKKLVAVCFGHQLVAQAFGGETKKSDKGWGVGVHSYEVKNPQSWMKPALQNCKLVVSHKDQVIQLPDNAVLLAGNEFCPFGMFQRGEHILAIQAHPEFSKDYAETLMRYRQNLLGETVFQQGIRSLQSATDETAIARWMLTFMTE